jgi:Zn-dependent protease with chaperone function
MSIVIRCDSCKASFGVNNAHAGKRARCPRCHAAMQVPPPLPAVEVETDAAATSESAEEAAPALTKRAILRAFRDDIVPVRTTLGYRLGMLVAGVALVLLPILYVALICGIAYLLYYHVTQDPAVELRTGRETFVWYVVPFVAGCILLLFMVKPLFARTSRTRPLQTLESGEEPLLFALVRRVALAVGAPEPTRIDLDCQVNASAGFGSILGGDLVLTIGLPLVVGLDIEQFASVVAHELGHFSQGTAMRLSYIVRTINAWFARVVYERDDLDELLVHGCETEGWIGGVLYVARFCVWLTRRVLWFFMVISHALSCFLMRQMEFDADRTATRLAGTEAFEGTERQLLLLNLVTENAYIRVLVAWYKKGRLPEDMSELIAALAESVDRKELRKVEKKMKKNKTGLFDTHPASADRLANVRREDAPGVFHLDGPATELFRDFPRLSRAVSLRLYRQMFGKRAKRDCVVPVSAVLGEEFTHDIL